MGSEMQRKKRHAADPKAKEEREKMYLIKKSENQREQVSLRDY